MKKITTVNKNPIISIITPTYNASSFINETIESVQKQSFQDWEMILVDDCSTDNTFDLILEKAKEDSRIIIHKLEENSGAAVARNKAISNARGKYIAFIDSDDIWLPEKLETQLAFMEEHEYYFTFTGYQYILENGQSTNKIVTVPKEVTYKFLLKNTIIGCSTVMLNIEKLGKRYMPLIRAGQDTGLWLNVLKDGHKAYGLNEVLTKYRKVSNSISSNKIKALKRTWNIYRKVEKLPLPYSIWCFSNYFINAIRKRL